MSYEAMLAGLEMTPFRKIGVKDLRPKIGKYSMARLYTILEYMFLFVKWENHSDSKGRSPLLEGSRTSEKPRADDDFSRSVLDSFSLVPVLSLNKAAKNLASQTSQTDLRPPKAAFICVHAHGRGLAQDSECAPTRIMGQ